MKKILFGWLTKSHYKITGIDNIIATIELIILLIIIVIVYTFIKEIKDKIKNKKRS